MGLGILRSMDLPEDTADRKGSQHSDPLDPRASDVADAWPPSNGNVTDEAADVPGSLTFKSDQWDVEVIPAKDSDEPDRFTRAIDILLNAAAHPRD